MIRHLLWCSDALLFNKHPAVTYVVSRSLAELGHPAALNVIDDIIHQSMHDWADILAQRFKISAGQLRSRSNELYQKIPPERQLPFPGVREVSDWAVANKGLNLVATGGETDSAQALLTAHGMAEGFKYVNSGERGWQGLAGFLTTALDLYTLKPAEVMLICNISDDVKVGRTAGVSTCIFSEHAVPGEAGLQFNDYGVLLAFLKQQKGVEKALPVKYIYPAIRHLRALP